MRILSEEEVWAMFPRLVHSAEPPHILYIEGDLPDQSLKHLCIVGARRHTMYGKEACEMLVEGLRGYPIVIVSGLALGIDGVAHRAALKAGLKTIAVPGSGLDRSVLYPATHHNLAEDILDIGPDGKTRGALLTEFAPMQKAEPWSFPQRNRIMAGLCDATLVIEADLKSGTLITSKLALDYNRDVLAVPGSVFSGPSQGPNDLISRGAIVVRTAADILEALGFKKEDSAQKSLGVDASEISPHEQLIFEMLHEPISRSTLVNKLTEESGMKIQDASILVSLMEIKGLIREKMGVMTAC